MESKLVVCGIFLKHKSAWVEFERITGSQFLTGTTIGLVSVIWYELVKIRTRLRSKEKTSS